MLSVVVPTRNEAAYVGGVVECIEQALVALELIGVRGELIISDSSADDGTLVAARATSSRNIIVVQHQRQGAGAARNVGAEAASGEVLLFIDADARPSVDGVIAAYSMIAGSLCDLATVDFYPLEKRFGLTSAYRLLNLYFRIFRRSSSPACCGFFLMVRADIFNTVGGFDGRLVLGEDHDIARRSVACGARFQWISGHSVLVSARRFDGRRGRREVAMDALSYLRSEADRIRSWITASEPRVGWQRPIRYESELRSPRARKL